MKFYLKIYSYFLSKIIQLYLEYDKLVIVKTRGSLMKLSHESLNYKWINYLIILIGVLVVIHIIKLIFPILKPVFSMLNMIICPFLIAICFAYLLNPLVDFFCRLKIKRSYSILITFISIIGAIIYAIFSLIPYLVVNTQEVMNRIPALMEKVQTLLDTWQFDYMNLYEYDFSKLFSQNSQLFEIFSKVLNQMGNWISSFSSSFTLVLGMIFLVPVVLYYILKNFYEIRDQIKIFLIKQKWNKVFEVLKESEEVVKGYVSGTLLVSLALSIIASIYFSIIGLDNAIVFGTLIGFLNIIPYVGQIIGTIPAAIFGLMVSVWTPVYVVLGVMALNFIEGNFIKPFVFSKSIDFHPIILLTLIIIGGQIFGVVGMIFIIPIAGILKIVCRYSFEALKEWKQKVRV